MDCPAIEWTPDWGGSQQKHRMGVTVRGCLGSLPGFETGSVWVPPSSPLQTTLRIFYSKQMLLMRDWEWYFPKNKQMGSITQYPMAAGPSLPMERTIIAPNLSSWHWNGPLQNILRNTCWTNPSWVRTDNNPLTYIMTTPNLDATGHQWVGALAKFNFQLEYKKGQDNTVADMLSQITTHLGPEAMQSILDGVTLGAAQRAEDDPAIVEGDHNIEKEEHVAAGQVLVEMHVTNWDAALREDAELDAVLHWLEVKKKIDLRTLLEKHAPSEEGWMVWRNCQNFTVLQDALYLHSMPKGDLLLFVVPKAQWTATLNGCQQDAGHQCSDHTLSLLQEHFWWTRMAKQMRQTIRACSCCLQYEGGFPKAPFMPHCIYCSPGSPACWLYKHWDHVGAKPIT